MTPYETLRAKVYEILYPEGIPLEFGCWVLDYKDGVDKVIAGSNGEEKVLIKGIGEIEKYKLLDINAFKILGKPLSLQDILRAVDKYKEGGDIYYLYANGWLMRDGQTHEGHRDGQMVCKLDLSKQIKDQDEEVLLKLIELICPTQIK